MTISPMVEFIGRFFDVTNTKEKSDTDSDPDWNLDLCIRISISEDIKSESLALRRNKFSQSFLVQVSWNEPSL